MSFHFSQIDPEKNTTQKKSTGVPYTYRAHCTWMMELSPGSIWEEGEEISSPGKVHGPFTIDARECNYFFPNNPPENFPFETLLPPEHLDFGSNIQFLSATRFAFVRVINAPHLSQVKWLIIPCAELFRYYFGRSTRLIAAAITGKTDRLIDLDRTTVTEKNWLFLTAQAISPNWKF